MHNTNNRLLRSLLIVSMIMTMLVALSATSVSASVKPKKITITPTKYTLTVGRTKTIKVSKVTPSKASKAVYYKSSNKSVATVSSKGVVKAKKAGKATITVTSKKNSKVKAKCYITVKAKPAAKPSEPSTPEAPSTPGKKSLVVYFTRAENTIQPYGYYDKLVKAEYTAGDEEEGGLYDAITGASLLKNDKGKIVGNVGIVAETIADQLNADTYSIHVTKINGIEQAYPQSKKDTQAFYREYVQNVGRPNPEIASMTDKDPKLEDYDVIYLGYPNWDGEPPHEVYQFINENKIELNKKTFILFSVNHYKRIGFDDNPNIISSILPGAAVLHNQYIAQQSDLYPSSIDVTRSAIRGWIKAVSREAEAAEPDPTKKVELTQKEKAEAIVGQELTYAEIRDAVGEWDSKHADINGCYREVTSMRFFYTGFVIYTRPVGIENETLNTIGEDTLFEIIQVE